MNPKANRLLTLAATLYAAAALPLLFTPQELISSIGASPSPSSETVLQVLAGALFGFAMINWMNRYSRLGGIFGRPLIVANFAHAAVALPALVRLVLAEGWSVVFGVPLVLYALLVLAFGSKLFGPTPVD